MIKFESLPADILSRIPEVKRVLAEDDTIVFAYIFGGLAEGKVKPLSDLDIAVYIRDMSDLAEYKINLFGRIANSIGTSELDLIILNTASISITGRILQKKQILIDKAPTVRHAYESLTLRKFFDFKLKEEKFFSLRYGIGR